LIISVNRDDRCNSGAPTFVLALHCIGNMLSGCSVEALIPDFKFSL
jgi:lipoate synthase